MGIDEPLAPAPQRLSLLPGEESVAEIVLEAPREQSPPAGTRVIGVKVSSVADPSLSNVEEVTLTISVLPAASLGVEPPVARGGESASFTVGVVNRGNVPLQLRLRDEDNHRAVRFQFRPATLEVPLGGRARANLQVSASPPLLGAAVQRTLTIYADGGPAPLGYSVAFVQRSRVASGALRATIVAAAVVVLGAAVAAGSLLLNERSSRSTTGAATTRAGGPANRATGTSTAAAGQPSSPPRRQPGRLLRRPAARPRPARPHPEAAHPPLGPARLPRGLARPPRGPQGRPYAPRMARSPLTGSLMGGR